MCAYLHITTYLLTHYYGCLCCIRPLFLISVCAQIEAPCSLRKAVRNNPFLKDFSFSVPVLQWAGSFSNNTWEQLKNRFPPYGWKGLPVHGIQQGPVQGLLIAVLPSCFKTDQETPDNIFSFKTRAQIFDLETDITMCCYYLNTRWQTVSSVGVHWFPLFFFCLQMSGWPSPFSTALVSLIPAHLAGVSAVLWWETEASSEGPNRGRT